MRGGYLLFVVGLGLIAWLGMFDLRSTNVPEKEWWMEGWENTRVMLCLSFTSYPRRLFFQALVPSPSLAGAHS
jgi:hypothetical protein